MSRKTDRRKIIKRTADGKRTDRVKKAERERMLRLRNQGKTMEEIALELDRSERTVSKQLQKAQTDGSSQTSQKEVDPLVAKAQEQHLDEICSLIKEWKGFVYTPHIKEAIPGYHHPINDIEPNKLFEHLKEHVPCPTLWLNYTIWSDRIDSYLFSCAELMKDVRRDYRFNVDEYLTDDRDLIWLGNDTYAYHEPIIRRISNKALTYDESGHQIDFGDFLVYDDWGEYERMDEVKGEYTKTWNMYVDGIPVGRCIDKKLASEAYKVASEYHLNEAKHVIILFRELKSLEDKIRQDIAEALAYQDYRWHNCQFCKKYHFP